MNELEIEVAVAAIRQSRKYRDLCPETIRDVLLHEASRHRSLKDALPHARRRLHRLWATFLGEPDYDEAAQALRAAVANSDSEVRDACSRLLNVHASSAERIPELPEFFRRIFATTGEPSSIADLACALNPLSFRWTGLLRTVEYRAYDINRRTVELVNEYFRLEGLTPLAEWRDVLCSPPTERLDLALLLKMYHCLEHRRKGAGWRVVESANARWLAVSFPTRNLHERRVDIAGNYEPTIRENAAARGWDVTPLDFATERVMLIEKRGAAG